MKKIDLRKGSGEYIALCVVAPMICSVIIMLCAFIQLSVNIHELSNATSVTGRSVAVCESMEDALIQSQRVAESAITSNNVSNIRTTVEYATADTEWKTGVLVKVTVYADIKTVAPFLMDGTRKKTTIISVEGNSNDDLNLLAALICSEGGASYEDKLAVGTVVMNRLDIHLYGAQTIKEVIYAPSQFEGIKTAVFRDALQNGAPDECLQIAREILLEGKRSSMIPSNCIAFRALSVSEDEMKEATGCTHFLVINNRFGW